MITLVSREEDLLDMAPFLAENSRLGEGRCCAIYFCEKLNMKLMES